MVPGHRKRRGGRRRKAAKKRPVPTNPTLYARVKAEARESLRYTLPHMQMGG